MASGREFSWRSNVRLAAAVASWCVPLTCAALAAGDEPAKVDFVATHSADLCRALLSMPRPRQAGERPAARPARRRAQGGRLGRVVRGRQQPIERNRAARFGRRSRRADAAAGRAEQAAFGRADRHDRALDRPGRRVARAQGGRFEPLGVSADRAARAAGGQGRSRGRAGRSIGLCWRGSKRAAIAPSPEADRYTLIKRLSYDLVGLPPEPAEVDAFVADQSPDAYEKLVDRLLDSPHFGERWGRHWLDMARYADSDGYEKDNPRPDAWRYRDWVIDAVNADMPLDRFTIEQLAGDLLPGATRQRSAGHGLSSPDADQHRRGRRSGAVSRRGDLRSRGHHRQRVAGADRRLRPVPHAQVRPDHARGVLPALRVLQQRRRDRDRSAAGRRGARQMEPGNGRRRAKAGEVGTQSWPKRGPRWPPGCRSGSRN